MANLTPYEDHPALVDALPTLIRRQRKLAKKVAELKPAEADEKAVRAEIDALLVAEGLASGEGVECQGYDVIHRERDGNAFISRELLLAAGVEVTVIDACIDHHQASKFATVAPAKGATVRRPKAA